MGSRKTSSSASPLESGNEKLNYATKADLERFETGIYERLTSFEKELRELKMRINDALGCTGQKSQKHLGGIPLMVPSKYVGNSLTESDVEIIPFEFYLRDNSS